MPPIISTKGIKHTVSYVPVKEKSCKNCSIGDLEFKTYRRWLCFLNAPILPLDVFDSFYECSNCHTIVKEEKKGVFEENPKAVCTIEEEAKLIIGQAQIAVMTHMALIDNDFDKLEEEEIQKVLSKYEKHKEALTSTYEKIKKTANANNQVFEYLSLAKEKLSTDTLLNVLRKAAVVLLADGKIEKEEEKLMKKYLAFCDVPVSMYEKIISDKM